MAASEKVYVCGRCEDFGAPNLEELVLHMTNCGYPELRKKDDTDQSDESCLKRLLEENGNSESAVVLHISADTSSAQNEEEEEALEESLVTNPHSSYTSRTTIDAGQSSPSPFIWNKKTALLLLKLVKEHRDDMESPYIRRKTVWQKIGVEMQEKYGYNVTPAQCENKFKNMSNRYKKARESNLRPDGRMKQSCFLYNELDEYYRTDPRFSFRNESRYSSGGSRFAEVVRNSKCIDQKLQYIKKNPIITLTDSENLEHLSKPSNHSETEPLWVKRVVETLEKCHRENMEMQREFLNVFKQILEKK